MKPLRTCSECNGTFRSFRADALTCGPTCKKRRQRRIAGRMRIVSDAVVSIDLQLSQLREHAKSHKDKRAVGEVLTALGGCQGCLEAAAAKLEALDKLWLQGTARSVPVSCRERGQPGTSPH